MKYSYVAERLVSLFTYAAATCIQLITFAFIGDDCRGPGAEFPGGCSNYEHIVNSRFYFLFVAEFLLLVGLLTLNKWKPIRPAYRILFLAGFCIFLAMGESFVFMPPLPLK
ncbi:MAG TPA: hypothetical protein VII92_16035 [Anaerolineae bacterium]